MRERGRMDGECWLGIMAVAGAQLCGGEEKEKIMVVDRVQDSKLS